MRTVPAFVSAFAGTVPVAVICARGPTPCLIDIWGIPYNNERTDMRDPYRGVYGDYTPLTYSIGSVVEAKHHKSMLYKANAKVIKTAAETFKEGIVKIGTAFQKAFGDPALELIEHKQFGTEDHSEWEGNWTHDEPSSDITKAGDLEANRV